MLQYGSSLRWPRPLMVAAGAILALALTSSGSGGVRIDFATELDPKIDPPTVVRHFSPRLKPLWLAALERPEAEMKRRSAETIAEAHRRGMPGLAETVPVLLKTLETPDQHPIVRLSVARALVVLDARQAAPVLWKCAGEGGLDMTQLVEPALARWHYAQAREAWLRRLEVPDTRQTLIVLAIEGLGAVREPRAVPRLKSLVRDEDAPPDLRLKAATALGTIQTEGLEDEAKRLAADRSPAAILNRLAAARLLVRHRGGPAQSLLLELAGDPEPAVAAIALGRLLEIDPMLVKVPMLQTLVMGPDANVRRLAAEFLVRHRTPETVALLGPVLDDEHPAVRAYVRDSLVELAKAAELDAPVRQAAMKMLATDRRRGLEQAAMVLGALDHKPAAMQLVELLDFRPPREPPPAPKPTAAGSGSFHVRGNRGPQVPPAPPPQPEDRTANPVNVAAAWALRRLAVPATAEGIAKKLGREMDWTKAFNDALIQGKPPGALPPSQATYDVAEQLIQAVGVLRYRPFDARLREFLPLVSRMAQIPRLSLVMQDRLRGTAAWALGHLYADEPNEALTGKLIERLNAVTGEEDLFVGRMAAVSLGRMKASSAVPLLRKLYNAAGTESMLNDACGWALRRITGERIPDPIRKNREIDESSNWFLVPRD